MVVEVDVEVEVVVVVVVAAVVLVLVLVLVLVVIMVTVVVVVVLKSNSSSSSSNSSSSSSSSSSTSSSDRSSSNSSSSSSSSHTTRKLPVGTIRFFQASIRVVAYIREQTQEISEAALPSVPCQTLRIQSRGWDFLMSIQCSLCSFPYPIPAEKVCRNSYLPRPLFLPALLGCSSLRQRFVQRV